MGEAVVKVDSELLERVEKLIGEKDKRIKYSSRKQFVDIAIFELIERETIANLRYKRGKNQI